jgi:transmembrane sensor
MSGTEQGTREALRDEAVAWLVRVQSDAATADDWSALTDWLESSEARVAAFEEAELILADLDARKREISQALEPSVSNVVNFPKRTLPRRAWVGAAIAASLAAMIGGPALWDASQGQLVTYQTRPGEVRRITLPDGSRVVLDGGSQLSVRLGWRVRRVEMGIAQASFDVAKDASRPFVINVGDQRVRVVGTAFNIRHTAESLRVTVVRGIVEVAPKQRNLSAPVRLLKGQELCHRQGGRASLVRRVNPEGAFAWSEGQLVADNESLGEVALDLNRRFPTPVRIEGASASKRFTGVIALEDQDAAVRLLATYAGLKVHRANGEIVLK